MRYFYTLLALDYSASLYHTKRVRCVAAAISDKHRSNAMLLACPRASGRCASGVQRAESSGTLASLLDGKLAS